MITNELKNKILEPTNIEQITKALEKMGYCDLMLIQPMYDKNKDCLNFVYKKTTQAFVSFPPPYDNRNPLADWAHTRTLASEGYLGRNIVVKLYGSSTFSQILWYGCEDKGKKYPGMQDMAVGFKTENNDRLTCLFDEKLIPISESGLEKYFANTREDKTKAHSTSIDQDPVSTNNNYTI